MAYNSNDIPKPTAQTEPLDTPLPCDVKVGHVTICKGVALSVLVARMQVLYDMAQSAMAQPEQEPDDLTIEYMAGLSRGKDLAPQRKPLVVLTDEEIDTIDAYVTKSGYCQMKFARAIETKLNEKKHMKDLYASEEECKALIQSDIRTAEQKKSDEFADKNWANEQGIEPQRKPLTQDLNAPLTLNGVALYPRQQPLTDEEIYKIANDLFYGNGPCDTLAMCRAIEQAHGIKE